MPTRKRMLSRLGTVAVAVGLLAGCNGWLQPGYGPEHRRHNPMEDQLTAANVDTLTQLWSTGVGPSATEAVVDGGRVFVVALTGPVTPRPFPTLFALDAETGALQWADPSSWGCDNVSFLTWSALTTPPAVVGDRVWWGGVFICNTRLGPVPDPQLISNDKATGVEQTVESAFPLSNTVAAGDVLLHARPGGSGTAVLVVRDPAGEQTLFTTTAFPVVGRPVPAVAAGHITVPTGTALDSFDLGCTSNPCPPTWTLELDAALDPTPMMTIDGRTVVTTQAGDVVVVRRDGEELWRGPLGGQAAGTALAEDVVYVAAGGSLHAYDADGCGTPPCSPLWTAALPATATSAPTVAGGVVYVGTVTTVQAFDTAGALLASVPVPAAARHLTVAGGRLFVSSEDHVTAFAPDG